MVSASILSEFDSASEASEALRRSLVAAVRPGSPDFVIRKISLDLTDMLDGLQREIEMIAAGLDAGGAIRPLDQKHHFVIDDTFGGRVMVRRYSDGGLVVVDRNFFLVLICYVFFQTRADGYGPGHAAWILLHTTILPSEPFPLLEAFYLFCLRLNQQLVGDLCRSVGFFLLAHELGHRHALEHGTAYLSVQTFGPEELQDRATSIRDFRVHPDGAIYNILLDGQQPPPLVFPADRPKWIDELYADLFSCYLQVTSQARSDDGLELLANQLCVWQQILRILDLRQRYHDRSPIELLSHPPSTIRVDSMIYHFEKLALEFSPDFRSRAISVLHKQYEKTWAASFFEAWSEACTFAFYTIDSTAWLSHLIHTKKKQGRPYSPGVFRRFLEDFAVPAVRLIANSAERDIETAWTKQLSMFNRSCKVNGQLVMDRLAAEIRGIELQF